MIYRIQNEQISRSNLIELKHYIDSKEQMGLDTETTSLDPYYAKLLLVSIGDAKVQYVVNATKCDITFLNDFKHKKFIGHNIKFDYKVLKVQGVELRKLYDTMIAEQRIRKNLHGRYTLSAVLKRRFDINLPKDIRGLFQGLRDYSVLENRSVILYSAADVEHLTRLFEKQQQIYTKMHMKFLVEQIEFRIIPIIGDTELEGLLCDEKRWEATLDENYERKIQLETAMDEELKKNRLNFKTFDRYYAKNVQTSLFGPAESTVIESKAGINYSSPKQILEIFDTAGIMPPIGSNGPTTGDEQLKQMILDGTSGILTEFIKLLIDHREVAKRISSFGLSFVSEKGYKNRVTGKLHTIYRTCSTKTGRFSSGDSKHGYFNSQQVPKEKMYRECFITDPGYKIMTIDYSGAELIILGSLADDKELIRLQSTDIHSFLATNAYTQILRILNTEDAPIGIIQQILSSSLHKCTESEADLALRGIISGNIFTVDKTSSLCYGIRTDFKNVVYGVAYGAGTEKIAETLGIPEFYGRVVYDSLKKDLPATFKYLEENSQIGLKQGYLVFNDRTNSRAWFPEVLSARVKGARPPQYVIEKIQRDCKNYPIQGTQSDMIKEAIVETDRFFKQNNYDCMLLLAVHDEGVYKIPDDLAWGIPGRIQQIWNEVANRYLREGIKMNSEYELLDSWTK